MMKLLLSVTMAHLRVIWALPSQLGTRIYIPCPNNLYDTAYCCSQSPLGDYVDCASPALPTTNAADFQNQCAWVGQIPLCCVRPLIGTPVVFCTDPLGLGPFGVK
ncbi:hypothetical protein F5Y01DRAFT_296995 [Xylaria sp. FL0043]|nr:hypothetical protein F5Y01DRAFT_296995 [Xylaria sp. FL0043]